MTDEIQILYRGVAKELEEIAFSGQQIQRVLRLVHKIDCERTGEDFIGFIYHPFMDHEDFRRALLDRGVDILINEIEDPSK